MALKVDSCHAIQFTAIFKKLKIENIIICWRGFSSSKIEGSTGL